FRNNRAANDDEGGWPAALLRRQTGDREQSDRGNGSVVCAHSVEKLYSVGPCRSTSSITRWFRTRSSTFATSERRRTIFDAPRHGSASFSRPRHYVKSAPRRRRWRRRLVQPRDRRSNPTLLLFPFFAPDWECSTPYWT